MLDSVSSQVLKIINTSLITGIFQDALKTTVVKPMLKKPNLDGHALTSYWPIANLPFINKILEKNSFSANKFLYSREYYTGGISVRLYNTPQH